MQTISCPDWPAFERHLDVYFARPADRRAQWVFRGHRVAEWLLQASVDRGRSFPDAQARQRFLDRCLTEFKRMATGLSFPQGRPETSREWELLARHHDLPSALLDWTYSPYVAAFFALFNLSASNESVAVLAFDRAYFEATPAPPEGQPRKDDLIEIWDEYEDLQVNPRAVEQASVSMRVNRTAPPLEEALGARLVKFVLPRTVRPSSLIRLASMGINARRLFRDLDHAAKSARWQIEEA